MRGFRPTWLTRKKQSRNGCTLATRGSSDTGPPRRRSLPIVQRTQKLMREQETRTMPQTVDLFGEGPTLSVTVSEGFSRTFDDPGPPAESLVCSHARGVSNQRVQRNLLRPSG